MWLPKFVEVTVQTWKRGSDHFHKFYKENRKVCIKGTYKYARGGFLVIFRQARQTNKVMTWDGGLCIRQKNSRVMVGDVEVEGDVIT